ncbi:hypothetical protein [Bailinhaonella thermotolerans]|uniref:Uncharacterized protein n=1 Tax=Bailinhaonella thermotolerans TaxID=1070861 RepID=A0A3A4ASB4_9ACTN|nr:hypothetical protein [Bailinhaonella thermotolerans]RJL31225.1 hypothetical protein D5H75_19350 [Bailinhaonella thermotolerans]
MSEGTVEQCGALARLLARELDRSGGVCAGYAGHEQYVVLNQAAHLAGQLLARPVRVLMASRHLHITLEDGPTVAGHHPGDARLRAALDTAFRAAEDSREL